MKHHIRALTGLRFFAALLVVLLHYGQPSLDPLGPLVGRIVVSGYQGVAIFFLLSGFILAYTYVEPSGTMRTGPGAFWVARFARVYPLYLVGLILGALTMPQRIWQSVFLLQAWMPHILNDPNLPGWSISVEAFFYALFPLLVRWMCPLRARTLWLLVLGAWCVLFATSGVYLLLHPDAGLWYSPWMQQLTYSPLSRFPEFVIGLALGRLYLNGLLPRVPVGPALLAVGVALWASPSLPYALTNHGLFDPAFALLLISLVGTRGRLRGALASRPAVTLGEASYALYILQAPLWAILCRLDGIPVYRGQSIPRVVLLFAASLLIASLIAHRYLEAPMRSWIRIQFEKRWSPAPEQGVAS